MTPATVPGSPTELAVGAGDGSATLTFLAPVDDGGSPVTGYVVTFGPEGQEMACPESPCVAPGLDNGTAYDFSVQAVNDVGRSEATSTVSATPLGAPEPPTDVTAT